MGAGKSTLLRICAGLLEPDSGWVRFGDVQYTRPRLHQLSRAGLYFMGEASGLAESLTLRQHFRVIADRFGVSLGESLIDLFSLSLFMDTKPHRLSTGERRRAELALAISRHPKCFVADEPFRGLDPLTCELLGWGIRRLASDGCAVIVSGHEIHTILEYVDCVTWVTAGTTYQLGTREEASHNERFVREYLGQGASVAHGAE